MKDDYIKNEIWTLIYSGAFQRAGVYRGNVTQIKKQELKFSIRSYIENNLQSMYINKRIDDQTHINNIYALSESTRIYSKFLKGGKLNFGVCQKILNLYLKYLWCLDEITDPPHFPVDRRIQEVLKINPIMPWTTFKDHKNYMIVINKARENIGKYTSIAELELDLFQRRAKTK